MRRFAIGQGRHELRPNDRPKDIVRGLETERLPELRDISTDRDCLCADAIYNSGL
jgi:hypothetical protein